MHRRFAIFAFSLLLCLPAAAHADNAGSYVLTLKDGKFSPPNLTLPANRKVKLTVKNESAMPAEFESSDLDREQVVAAHDSITVYLGPLDAGVYGYFNDFDRKVSGKIEVK
ncbi:MAG: cupredoxin domain-containing protein [Alphaproteobacteria bacterium]|nr:cupredoxin domain-containing protein [Alphaproteobacteria bacterium]MDE2337081.1 cupredoxin domain-containing protein [Alphaproteobacteria bacterium]